MVGSAPQCSVKTQADPKWPRSKPERPNPNPDSDPRPKTKLQPKAQLLKSSSRQSLQNNSPNLEFLVIQNHNKSYKHQYDILKETTSNATYLNSFPCLYPDSTAKATPPMLTTQTTRPSCTNEKLKWRKSKSSQAKMLLLKLAASIPARLINIHGSIRVSRSKDRWLKPCSRRNYLASLAVA